MSSIRHATVAEGLSRRINDEDWDADHVINLTEGKILVGGPGDVAVEADPPTGGGGGGAVDSVNGQVGVVVLTKNDVGLSNVDNTSDVNKPISTAVATALTGKQASGSYLTSVTVTAANGVSASSTGGLTPALTFTLGSITPTSLTSTGLVKGSKITAGTTADAPTLKASGTESLYNLGIGTDSLTLVSITTGNLNVAVGAAAGNHITTGPNNLCIGVNAGFWITGGGSNVAIGTNALFGDNGAITGNENMAIGGSSLKGVTSGQRNVAVGDQAGFSVTLGSNNLFIGWAAGYGITTGSGNIILGYQGSALPVGTTNLFQVVTGAGIIITNTTGTMAFSQNISAPNLSNTNTGDQTSVTGNAGTATKLLTARNINGVAFDGTANITINAVDSTARVPATRLINTTAPLAGGGDLSADRTLSITAASGVAAGSMSSADFTKLAGVATGATANSTDATLLARANHTGTQAPATVAFAATARFLGRITAAAGPGEELTGTQATTLIDLATGALKGAMSAADFTKLAGVATGATADTTATVVTKLSGATTFNLNAGKLVFTHDGSNGYIRGAAASGDLNLGANNATQLLLKADGSGVALTGTLTASGTILSTGTAGIGYATGAGGAVTQLTSRTTGVTLNKPTGSITLFSTTTTANLVTTFTVTNSSVALEDTVNLSVRTATGVYLTAVTKVAAGSFNVSVFTPAAVGVAEAPILNFAVVKAVAA